MLRVNFLADVSAGTADDATEATPAADDEGTPT
jgi:hypothetical protein